MRADIGLAKRTENGIGQRMQCRIGIGVAREPVAVRDAHAAQRHRVAGREGMDVDALADPHIRQPRQVLFRQKSVGLFDIFGGGDLAVLGAAGNNCDLDTRPLGHRRIVGQVDGAFRDRRPVRREDRLEIEALRRLDAPHAGPVDGALDQSTRRMFQRVGNRQARHDAGMAVEPGNHMADQVARGEGPGAIVDQHFVGIVPGDRLDADAAGLLPGPAANDRRLHGEAAGGLGEHRFVAGGDHRLDMGDARMVGEGLERPPDQRLSADWLVLLRPFAARPQPRSAGHDHCCHLHGARLAAVPMGRN